MAAGKQSSRNASLNDAKERAAGRQNTNPQLNEALDPDNSVAAKGETGGAFGKDNHAHRNTSIGPGAGGASGDANLPSGGSAAGTASGAPTGTSNP
jgi:hypothetical protein